MIGREVTGRSAWWAIPGLALAVTSLALGLTDKWPLLGIRSLGTYVDLAQVTYNASCADPSAGDVGATVCDPLGRAYNYPPAWAKVFRFLGLGAGSTVWLGTVLVALGIVSLTIFYIRFAGRPTIAKVAALTALTCSPPLLLMVARANIDLIVLALLVASALLIRSHRSMWATPLVAIAAGAKLFPVGAVVAFRTRRTFWISVVLSVGLLILSAPYLRQIRAATPSVSRTTIGAGVLPSVARIRGFGRIDTSDQIVGVALFLAVAAALMVLPFTRRAVQSAVQAVRPDETTASALLIGAGPALASYLFTSSFDYRLSSLLFVAAAFVRAGTRELWAVVGLLVVAFWADATRGPGELIEDLVLLAVMPFLALAAGMLFIQQMRSLTTVTAT